jgi:hypothetical protein
VAEEVDVEDALLDEEEEEVDDGGPKKKEVNEDEGILPFPLGSTKIISPPPPSFGTLSSLPLPLLPILLLVVELLDIWFEVEEVFSE